MFGKVIHWNKKGYGILEVKNEQNHITRFYLHRRYITLCEPDEPEYGNFAVFEVPEQLLPADAKPGYLLVAHDVAIYSTKSAGMRALEAGFSPKAGAR